MSVDFIEGTCASETPKHLTSGSVGSDLFSTKNYLIHPCKSTLIECRLHIKIPRGYFGLIWSYPTYKIDKGDRIAQITLVKCDRAYWKEVKDFDMENYGDKLRVEGFGSNGK